MDSDDDKIGGCLIRSIRFCLNVSIHYFVVQLVVREPLKQTKGPPEPEAAPERKARGGE